jgi:hypothetical protein
MKKENKKHTCSLNLNSAAESSCKNIHNFNVIRAIKIDKEGNCYDELHNYLGKGIIDLIKGYILVTKENGVESYYYFKQL